MDKFNQVIAIWRGVFRLLRTSAPKLSVAITIVTIVEAFAGIGLLFILKVLVDTITSTMTSQTSDGFSSILVMLLWTGFAIIGVAFIQGGANVLRMRQGLLVSDHVDREIHARAISVDLQHYETAKYYDALERAKLGGTQRPAQIVANSVIMLRAILTLLAIFVILGNIEFRLLPLLCVPIAIAMYARLFYARKLFDWRMSRAQKERRARYLDWLMTNENHAKDLRLNRIGPHLKDQYLSIRKDIRAGEIRIEQTRLITEFLFAFIGAVIFIGASAWLLLEALDRGRPIGDVVLFVLLLRRAETAGREFVGNVSKIVDDHLYLLRLFDFLSIKAGIAKPKTPTPIPTKTSLGFRLEHVSFQYVDTDEKALDDVSMKIEPGKIVGLVGENGSGKTSLIKVLTRLYDPAVGKVTFEGIDARAFDPVQYRELISVIFQNFAMYSETVSENIRFGDIHLPPSAAKITRAAEDASASDFIERLPQRYETPLTRLFDNGQQLSIGQWQRIALARAFYPKSKLVILDEPTSAVDPKAEFELFENFRSRLGTRSALIISHRLSTIRQADYTYVLKSGRIVEHGTHDDLISTNGHYADLFKKQAKYYR